MAVHQARWLLPGSVPSLPLLLHLGRVTRPAQPPIMSPRPGAPAGSVGCTYFYSERTGHVTWATECLFCSICGDLFHGPEYACVAEGSVSTCKKRVFC